METPSSTRRVTRSQTLTASANNCSVKNIPTSSKDEDSEKGFSKSRPQSGKQQQDRSALIDITNDSPIVGVAKGGSLETPSSTLSKKKRNGCEAKQQIKTPGSGEDLLRGQVKTLLQKVEEEAEISKLSVEQRKPLLRHHLPCFLNSPGLLAPTPANTPQVLNLSDEESFRNGCLALVTPSPVQEQLKISQMFTEIPDGTEQEDNVDQSEKSLIISRSLLLDFSEKSESSDSSECFSVLTHKGDIGEESSEGKEKSSMEDDDSSVWSIQVNASTKSEEEEEEEEEEEGGEENYNDDDDGAEEEDDGGLVDQLCEGMSNMRVNGENTTTTKFTGKHTRFVYNSDDEIEREEEVGAESHEEEVETPGGIVRLKGLPTPKGKHLRFLEGLEEEEEDN